MKPVLTQRAERAPDALALVAGNESLAYGALEARVARRAGSLLAAGVAPGARVALLMGNRPALVEWVHAAARARAIVAPLNVRLSAPELARQLEDARAHLLVHDDDEHAARALEAGALARIPVHASRALAGGAPAPICDVEPGDVAALVYTSGTSGEPKGVALTHANLWASALGSALHLGALAGDRWLAVLPLFHVGGLSIVVRSALIGSSVWLHERFDPAEVALALERDSLTLASFVPTMLARLLEIRGEARAPSALRAVLLGGAAAPPALLERAAARGWPILSTYGLTEASSQVATSLPGATTRADGGGLRPLFGVDVELRGERGEICVRGPTVSPGYWDRELGAVRARATEWLHTGDLGQFERDGSLRVVGRADDLLVTGGENVHPAEVEAALAAHPDVREVGVAGLPDPEFGARVAAWIVLAPGARPDPRALEAFTRTRLAGYKVPRSWRFVDELPRNAGGKLLRRALADRETLTPAR